MGNPLIMLGAGRTGDGPVPITCTLERNLTVVKPEVKKPDIGPVGTPAKYPLRW